MLIYLRYTKRNDLLADDLSFRLLKEQFTLNPNIHILPSTCGPIDPSGLFGCKLWNSRDTGCQSVCMLEYKLKLTVDIRTYNVTPASMNSTPGFFSLIDFPVLLTGVFWSHCLWWPVPILDWPQARHNFPFKRMNDVNFPVTDIFHFLHKQCCEGHLGSFHTSGNLWRLDICFGIACMPPNIFLHDWNLIFVVVDQKAHESIIRHKVGWCKNHCSQTDHPVAS